MAEFTFYTVAMSRGQISRWALHEAGADYDHVVFDWASRPDSFKAINPMNKPAVISSMAGYRQLIGARQWAHRPRKAMKLSSGMFSCHRRGC